LFDGLVDQSINYMHCMDVGYLGCETSQCTYKYTNQVIVEQAQDTLFHINEKLFIIIFQELLQLNIYFTS
jgi:hypothetical protein